VPSTNTLLVAWRIAQACWRRSRGSVGALVSVSVLIKGVIFGILRVLLCSPCLPQVKPTHVLNAAGLTGRPNVDWCETHKVAYGSHAHLLRFAQANLRVAKCTHKHAYTHKCTHAHTYAHACAHTHTHTHTRTHTHTHTHTHKDTLTRV
jgi:hypothetical protein